MGNIGDSKICMLFEVKLQFVKSLIQLYVMVVGKYAYERRLSAESWFCYLVEFHRKTNLSSIQCWFVHAGLLFVQKLYAYFIEFSSEEYSPTTYLM